MNVLTEDRDEAAWLDWRRAGVTATDVAEATDGTYGGAYQVIANKLGVLPPVATTAAMERGHRWQATIADAVHTLTGWFVVGEETWCEGNDQRWRCTVDGLLAAAPEATMDELAGVLEIKTVGAGTRHSFDRWNHQVQWQLLVTGLQHAVLAVATIDDGDDTCSSLRLHRIEADSLHQQMLVGVAEFLWEHMERQELPDPDGNALDTVKRVWATADPDADPVDLADLGGELDRLANVKQQIKNLQTEADAIEALVRSRVADSTAGHAPGWAVKVSEPASQLSAEAEADLLAQHPHLATVKLDRTRAKKELGEQYLERCEPTGARRFTFKPVKGTD
jgi:predicted phage-related endonuclease